MTSAPATDWLASPVYAARQALADYQRDEVADISPDVARAVVEAVTPLILEHAAAEIDKVRAELAGRLWGRSWPTGMARAATIIRQLGTRL